MTSRSERSALYGFTFWIALIGVGSFLVTPLQKHLKLGIDLVGGYYITLQVQTDEAVKVALQSKEKAILHGLRDSNLVEPSSYKVGAHSIILDFAVIDDAHKAVSYIKSHMDDLSVHSEGAVVTARLPEHEELKIKEWAVQSNIEVLRRRLDKGGVSEISISKHGDRDIIVELPNVDDPARAKEMIGKAAQLEIKLVEKANTSEDELLDEYDGILPSGMMISSGKEDDSDRKSYYLVPDYTDLTGSDLRNAEAALGGMSGTEPVVSFEFSKDGGSKFYDLTSKNHGKQIAIIIDDIVISAPRVNTTISDKGIIQGSFTWDSARDLAISLKSGAFVAPVKFEEERRIGATLGWDSVKQGMMACAIGMTLLLVFCLIVYKMCGLLAFMALLVNLTCIVFGLSWLKATLTLPGIAGIVLTLGMAIDFSILIYEKMKESLSEGISFRKAVDIGFSDALAVILDANITTFLMGLVLYIYGTGPIQGFAATMMIGIVSTLVTGLFFLRALFNFVLYVKPHASLSI